MTCYSTLTITFILVSASRTNKHKDFYFELRCPASSLSLSVEDALTITHGAKSERNARKLLPNLEEVTVFPDVGHGIETYREAVSLISS